MPALNDDEISVEMVDGTPAVFWWQRFPYRVVDTPQLFYKRRPPWWTGQASMLRIDDEYWRVAAVRDGSDEDTRLYDLRYDGERWTLAFQH